MSLSNPETGGSWYKSPPKHALKKTPRAREYTGPATLEAVKEFFQTDALQKAKEQAAASLSEEDQIKLMEWSRQLLRDAIQVVQKDFETKRAAHKKGL